MRSHLLAISIGPVQEFIAAARRTRDLWFGSYLLSEISKAVARSVSEIAQPNQGELIFPAPTSPSDLASDSPLNVANIVVAALGAAPPADVAGAAKAAAKTRWREFADQVLREYQDVIRPDIWKDQVDDVIEFYAAWVPLGEDYPAARRRLMRLLAGRKHCRDFLPAKGRSEIPKSSLDGLRESVLKDPKCEPRQAGCRRRLRVREGEQLDVIGIVKRAAEGHRPYPSVARIAADPWLRGVVASLGEDAVSSLRAACDEIGNDVLHQLDTSVERGYPHYAAFPYEGTAVFRSRHHELWEESRDGSETTDVSREKFKRLETALEGIEASAGTRGIASEPAPYVAVLVADGDRMGEAISRIGSRAEHQRFSRVLASFAGEARRIVDQQYGVLVYAGGDDVLAFVPTDRCLQCARLLHDKFGQLMDSSLHSSITLSVGIAIGHFMENLEDLLIYGREAETHAKSPTASDCGQSPRDGLAVHLLKRGGGPVTVRANWSDKMDVRLDKLAHWINNRAVSGRIAYDLRRIADTYDSGTWPNDALSDAIRRDTLSVMKGKQPAGESRMKEVEQFIRDRVNNASSLRRLSEELLIARQLAVAFRQASPASAFQEITA